MNRYVVADLEHNVLYNTNDGQLKNCTIVCVDTDVNSDSPVIVQNYGLMTKKASN